MLTAPGSSYRKNRVTAALLSTLPIILYPIEGIAAETGASNKAKQHVDTNGELAIAPSNWQQEARIKDFNQFLRLGQIRPARDYGTIKLSEAEIVKIALANSPEIRSSIYQFKQADYLVRSAYGAYYPNISAFNTSIGGNSTNTTFEYGGANWATTPIQKQEKMLIDASSSGPTNYYQGLLGIQISFNLIDVPRDLSIAQALESRNDYKKLVSYAVKQKLQSIRLAVLSIQTADQLISAYRKSAEFAKSAYAQILKSYNGGYSTKIDVDNYYALYNNYQANVASSLSNRQSAVSQLLSQMSWPQTVDIDVNGTMQTPRTWPLSLNSSVGYAKEYSEQVQTLLIQSRINSIQAQSDIAAYLPVISLNAYGYTNGQLGTINIGDPAGTTSNSINSSVSLNLNWTIFDGLTNLNQARSAKQGMLSYEQQSKTQLFTIEQSVGSYYAAIKANTVAYNLNGKAYKAQQELTKLTLIGYKSGYNTVFDLVNAQQNTVNSLIGQIQSLQNVNSSFIQIQTNTGSYLCRDPVISYACDLLSTFDSEDFKNLDSTQK